MKMKKVDLARMTRGTILYSEKYSTDFLATWEKRVLTPGHADWLREYVNQRAQIINEKSGATIQKITTEVIKKRTHSLDHLNWKYFCVALHLSTPGSLVVTEKYYYVKDNPKTPEDRAIREIHNHVHAFYKKRMAMIILSYLVKDNDKLFSQSGEVLYSSRAEDYYVISKIDDNFKERECYSYAPFGQKKTAQIKREINKNKIKSICSQSGAKFIRLIIRDHAGAPYVNIVINWEQDTRNMARFRLARNLRNALKYEVLPYGFYEQDYVK